MSVVDWTNIVMSGQLTEDHLERFAAESDLSLAKTFYGPEKDIAKDCVKKISAFFVDTYLNNNNAEEVPLRRKTKYLLVLNNFALHKPVRNQVFNAIKNLSGIFEESMKTEGTMPFDSELGRMSEHVLVLLMRVMSYKLKAMQVHEFAEGNTQFAVQLLLAILLKEPAYEFELRCNCISGLLGFTQPQAFFNADQAVEVHSCEGFTDKVNFILNLMLRLNALQVVNDVLSYQLYETPNVQPLVHVSICNIMRCVMNIYQFCSEGSTQWQQHVILSTTFVDNVTTQYLEAQVRSLQSLLSVTHNALIPNDLLNGVSLALKFSAFGTFHMGRHGQSLRPICVFIHDLLQLRIRPCLDNPMQMPLLLAMYTNLFHFLANIDALSGDDEFDSSEEELPDELRSTSIQRSIKDFLNNEIATAGLPVFEYWHQRFNKLDTDALVSQDLATFQMIDAIYNEIEVGLRAGAQPSMGNQGAKTLLGDMPSFKPGAGHNKDKKQLGGAVVIEQKFVAPKKLVEEAAQLQQPSKFTCALNGHTMKTPVTSPYGHTFEKETIEQWIRQQGSICPITGKPLSIGELAINKKLQQEIMQLVIQESMSNFNQEDAADLYDF